MNTTRRTGWVWKGFASLVLTCCMVLCLVTTSAQAVDQSSYVVLGDSISTGYGLSSSDLSFASMLASDNRLDVTMLAHDGETTASLLSTVNGNPDTIRNADVITITIGGNDMMNAFYEYLATSYTAANPSDPVDAETVKERLAANNLPMVWFVISNVDAFGSSNEITDALEDATRNFTAALSSIRNLNPDAYLIVTTQYNPYAYTAASSGLADSMDSFEQVLTQLNGAIRLGSSALDYQVADVYTAFSGASSNPCNANLDMANLNLDFHPNAYGHELIAAEIQPLIDFRAALTPGAHTFDTQPEGYTTSTPQTFTIENVGNGDLSSVSVTLTGSDPDAFQLDTTGTATELKSSESTTFTVVPAANLTEGSYEATVTVSANGMRSVSSTVSFTVDPPPTYLLTVENGTGGGSFQAGEKVTITSAAPDASGHFSSWSITSGSGGTIEDSSQAETFFTMPAEPVTVTATFEAHTPEADDGDCTTPILCAVCDYAVTPGAASHTFGTYTYNQDATCTQDGTETAKCEHCDVTDTRDKAGTALGHDYGSPQFHWAEDGQSCEVALTCARDHTHTTTQDATVSSSILQQPTCTQDGVTKYTATLSFDQKEYQDDTTRADIPMLGHDFVNYTSNGDATCTQDGTETATCERCSATDTRTDTGSALGHAYGSPVFQWSEDFQACTVTFTCAHDDTHQVTQDATVTSKITQEPTCTQVGAAEYTASLEFEGNSYKEVKSDSQLPALGHDFVNYTSNGDATCTQDGTETATCERCSATDTRTEAGSALGHDLIFHEGQAPTCTEDGWADYDTCSRCDYSTYQSLDATGHSPKLRNQKDATCTAKGYSGDLYCTVCGVLLEKGHVTDKIPHDYKWGVCTVCDAEDPDYTPPFWLAPATGDTSTPLLWVVILVVAGAVVVGLIVYNRKKHNKR